MNNLSGTDTGNLLRGGFELTTEKIFSGTFFVLECRNLQNDSTQPAKLVRQGSTEFIQQCQSSETSQQGDLKNMILGFQRDKLKMCCITFVLTHESKNVANQSQLIPVASPTVEGVHLIASLVSLISAIKL